MEQTNIKFSFYSFGSNLITKGSGAGFDESLNKKSIRKLCILCTEILIIEIIVKAS